MLLRTKLEPDVEEWFEEGQKYASSSRSSGAISAAGAGLHGNTILREDDRTELWSWAPRAANKEARKQKWGADYTLAEVQGGVSNVKTGLKRELIEPEGDEDMDDDEDLLDDEDENDADDADEVDGDGDAEGMAVTSQPGKRMSSTGAGSKEKILRQMPMESVHRFMTTGKVG
jgi:hypothetical protein